VQELKALPRDEFQSARFRRAEIAHRYLQQTVIDATPEHGYAKQREDHAQKPREQC